MSEPTYRGKRLYLNRRIMRRFLWALLLLLAPVLFSSAIAQSLQGLQLTRIEATQVDTETTWTAALEKCCSRQLQVPKPLALQGKATASLQPMFSSQADSWAFEPFARNGLFKIIGGYQPHHPKVLTLSGGEITLSTLVKEIKDTQVIKPFRDGFLLSYPLIIEAGAGLKIQNQKLYLHSGTGAAIINLGQLVISDATISTWKGENADKTDDKAIAGFRSFIVAWGGSRTIIQGSTLEKLGYNAFLTRGLTVIKSRNQGAATPPALLVVENSVLNGLASGIQAQDCTAYIRYTEIHEARHYAVDIENCALNIIDNRLDKNKHESLVRIRGKSHGVIADNDLSHGAKSGIDLTDQEGALIIENNRISNMSGNGIQIRNNKADASHPLRITRNIIKESGRSGIDGEALADLYIDGNTLQDNQDYDISLRNAPNARTSHYIITKNQLRIAGKAGLQVENAGSVILGANQFVLRPPMSVAYGGDLLPVQSQIMEETLKQAHFIRITHRNATD